MKYLGEEYVMTDEISNIVNENKIIFNEDGYNNDSIEDFKKNYRKFTKL